MLSLKASLNLEIGNWNIAYSIADNLLKNEDKPRTFKIGALIAVGTIKMRRGDTGALPLLLEAKKRLLTGWSCKELLHHLQPY